MLVEQPSTHLERALFNYVRQHKLRSQTNQFQQDLREEFANTDFDSGSVTLLCKYLRVETREIHCPDGQSGLLYNFTQNPSRLSQSKEASASASKVEASSVSFASLPSILLNEAPLKRGSSHEGTEAVTQDGDGTRLTAPKFMLKCRQLTSSSLHNKAGRASCEDAPTLAWHAEPSANRNNGLGSVGPGLQITGAQHPPIISASRVSVATFRKSSFALCFMHLRIPPKLLHVKSEAAVSESTCRQQASDAFSSRTRSNPTSFGLLVRHIAQTVSQTDHSLDATVA